jgi:hypothetical protein
MRRNLLRTVLINKRARLGWQIRHGEQTLSGKRTNPGKLMCSGAWAKPGGQTGPAIRAQPVKRKSSGTCAYPGKWASSGKLAQPRGRACACQLGSVTLEAAVVLPVFLLFAMLIIFLVQTAVMSMALQNAMTQTVRLAASAWYPIHLSQAEAGDDGQAQFPSGGSESGGYGKLKDIAETIGEYGEFLPSPLKEWAEETAGGRLTLQEEAAKRIFSSLVLSLADEKVLNAERFQLVSVQLPDQENGRFLALEGQYRLPFRVPFTGQPLIIRAAAAERIWAGGLPSRSSLPDPGGGSLQVEFVSLTPDPVRPGRKATLVLRTQPGAALDLSVIYKSGESKAKNLGRAIADDSGYVSWTWHVSGNTTSGQWTWMVSSEEGIYEQAFRVERYSGQEVR